MDEKKTTAKPQPHQPQRKERDRMTVDEFQKEFMTLAGGETVRRGTQQHPADEEHRLQTKCVKWFRTKYRTLNHCLFAVANGGRRDEVTGAKLKAEGVLAGVADLILLRSNRYYGALLIEMKTKEGRQSEAQKAWQDKITQDCYKYVVCRSFDDFTKEVNKYLRADGLRAEDQDGQRPYRSWLADGDFE